ncbi:MAG: hypothetical protein K9H26_08945 [Prolixibacteraceae bacterium]|nr:hypothetical protein [Prolixibacteraceae bacterium]
MKTSVKLLFIALAFSLLYSCKPDEPNNNLSSNAQFIGLYNPGETQLLGSNACMVVMSEKNGNVEYGSTYDSYPYDYKLEDCCVIKNNKMVIGLHSDFNEGPSRTGEFYDFDEGYVYSLPYIIPEEEDDYGSVEASSVTMSENGYVFYISATRDTRYADQYTPHLMRFDPESEELKVADLPHAFTLAQPEKGGDTEVGLFDNRLFPSSDGKYVYGRIEASGVDGGVFHSDYTFIFRYDFETDQYLRIADGHRSVVIYGMTANGVNLLFKSWDGTENKMFIYNTLTEGIEQRPFWAHEYLKNPSSWNNYGYLRDGGYRISYANVVDEKWVDVVQISGKASNIQFSKDKDFIYFSMSGVNENYMCKSSGLQAESTVDTLFSYSKEIMSWLVFK